MIADWNEKLAQMEFLLKEEECKRIDAEEKYAILEQEMISQSIEMEEKMAEMERMYMYRLLEQVPPQPPSPTLPTTLLSQMVQSYIQPLPLFCFLFLLVGQS
jgi:hypothetical protein